jgi:hypothetical protein
MYEALEKQKQPSAKYKNLQGTDLFSGISELPCYITVSSCMHFLNAITAVSPSAHGMQVRN